MKTVLLVDDDRQLLAAEARTFQRPPGQFRLLTAENGHDALAVLEARIIDLLVADLQMPVMDGFELLSRALVLQPDLSLLVMSEIETDSLEVALENPGTTEVLVKPIAPGLLLERARAIFARRTRGHLSGVSLSGFLQLLHLEGRSCALTVRADARLGTIDLFDGHLTSASAGAKRGIEAMFEILSWTHTDIEMVGTFVSSHRDIDGSLEGILLDAARTRDETQQEQALRSQWIASPSQSASSLPPMEISPKQRDTVQMLLHRLMLLEGALGATLIDTRTGLCLASESRRLKADLEEAASQFVTVVRTRRELLAANARDDRVERVIMRREDELEAYLDLPDDPLAVYLVARRDKTDEQEALLTLERIARKIQDAVAPRVISTSNQGPASMIDDQTSDGDQRFEPEDDPEDTSEDTWPHLVEARSLTD